MVKKLVIFDLDDTLIDNISSWPRILDKVDQRAQEKFGMAKGEIIELNKKHLALARQESKTIRVGLIGYYIWSHIAHELKLSVKDTADLMNWWHEFLPETLDLVPQALETLKALKEKEIKIVIVSSGGFNNKYIKIDSTGILPYVDLLLSTDLFHEDKPNPDPYRHALTYFQLEPKDALVVGDHYEHDLAPALDLGIDVVHFQSKRQEFPPKDLKISSITSLKDLLQHI
jgi:putative hydrolase of the HAD superfamily